MPSSAACAPSRCPCPRRQAQTSAQAACHPWHEVRLDLICSCCSCSPSKQWQLIKPLVSKLGVRLFEQEHKRAVHIELQCSQAPAESASETAARACLTSVNAMLCR